MGSSANHLRLVSKGVVEKQDRSDDELMTLSALGQEGAFVELIRRHESRVRRFCELLLGNRTQAEDVTQDVFLQLWSSRARFRPEGRFKELLFTIARNHVRSIQRRKWLRQMMSVDDLMKTRREPEAPANFEEALQKHSVDALVSLALTKLPDKFRVPLALRFMEGMPYEEIARVIGRTPSAARSRIHYGLKELAKFLPEEVCP